MSRIPTITSETNLRGGPVSPEADPLAFNPSAGMGQLGNAFAGTGEVASRIHAKKLADDEDRWIVNSSHAYNIEASQFEQENKNREDFAQATFDHLEQRKKEFLAKAPSDRAALRLQAQLDNQIESRYQQAHRVGEHTKLTNAHRDIDQNINDTMTAYRADAATSPDYAVKNLEPQMNLLKASVMSRWSKSHPDHASKLLEHIERQFIVGTAEHDPNYARKLLDESNFLDESGRAQLLNYIESQEKASNRLAQEDFANSISETLKYAKRTNGVVQDVPLATFETFYGKENGKIAKARFDRDAKEINQASAFVGKVAGKNVNALVGEFSNFVENKSISDAAKSDAAVTVKEMARQAQTDGWAYVAQHNPEVSKAYELAAQVGTPDAFSRANRIALEYQGYAPPDAPESERSKYQNLPTNARHLMSQSKAIAQAMQWRGPATEQSIKALNDFVMTYPEEQRAIAFNDLINLPPSDQKVSKTLEWAFLHRHKPFVKDFMDAQNNADALKNLTDEKRSDYETALFSDPAWVAFSDALLQGSVTRATEVSDYKNGLINYAYSMKGKSPKEAVREASKQLIGSEFAFPKVNGVTVMVAMRRPNGTYRGEDEVSRLPQQLTAAIQSVPVDQVQLNAPDGHPYWPLFHSVIGDKPLKDILPDLIKRHGFFVPTPNGQGATIYLHTDDGVTGQLLDKNNQPWEVDFDSLPEVSKEEVRNESLRLLAFPEYKWIINGRFWKNYPARDEYRIGPGMQPLP